MGTPSAGRSASGRRLSPRMPDIKLSIIPALPAISVVLPHGSRKISGTNRGCARQWRGWNGAALRGRVPRALGRRTCYPLVDWVLLHAFDRLNARGGNADLGFSRGRSEEHTSELQSLMRISYAVFGLKKT